MGNEVIFKIVRHLGNIGKKHPNGWQRELNLVSWNGNEPVYDIRDLSPDHERMSRGLFFKEEQIKDLKDLLNEVL